MPESGLDLKASSEQELNVLKGVIDYADRMIYEDRNFSAVAGMADPTGFHASSQAPLCSGWPLLALRGLLLFDLPQSQNFSVSNLIGLTVE